MTTAQAVWLTPANSINVGRRCRRCSTTSSPRGRTDVCVGSSGNFGNLTAGLIAKRLGVPVSRYVAATNVTDVVPEYLRSGSMSLAPRSARRECDGVGP